MSEKRISDGITMTFTASSAITAGDLVHIGAGLVGVAVDDVANGAVGVVEISGRFTVAKGTAASAYPVGRLLKLGTAGNTVDLATAGSSVTALVTARVAEASATGATTVEVFLLPK